MAKIITEEGRKKKNTKWLVQMVRTILALLVAWMALSDRSDMVEMEHGSATAVSLEQFIKNRTTAYV